MNVIQLKTTIVIETIKNIIKYQQSNVQRLLQEDHVNHLVSDQVEEYKKNGMFSILQSITCADLHGKRYILDGQHRIEAFKILGQLNYPLTQSIPLIIYKTDSLEELQWYYVRINKHHPINPLEMCDAWFKYGKGFCMWLKKQFSEYVKNTEKTCNCPNINLREIMEYMKRIRVFERLRTSIGHDDILPEFKTKILAINEYIATHYESICQIQFTSDIKRKIERCFQKRRDAPCFLGMWRQFEWIEIALYMIRQEMDISEVPFSLFNNERVKIPRSLRIDVWTKRNGNSMEGKCFVCCKSLQFMEMECGHVIPHACKGSISIDNLEPICKTCNRDMGIMNLNEYKSILHYNEQSGDS